MCRPNFVPYPFVSKRSKLTIDENIDCVNRDSGTMVSVCSSSEGGAMFGSSTDRSSIPLVVYVAVRIGFDEIVCVPCVTVDKTEGGTPVETELCKLGVKYRYPKRRNERGTSQPARVVIPLFVNS